MDQFDNLRKNSFSREHAPRIRDTAPSRSHPFLIVNPYGRISDLLKFLVPKVGESFVLDHNVESQEVAQARPRPELAGALETILELAAL